MQVQAPSPQTTLVILLGASTWPFSPEFQSSEAFANAARRLKAYFLNPQPFGLPAENLLDLFDANNSADELDLAIERFLQQRIATMKTTGNAARDLLVYFIGHGGFVGRDSDFYLAIRRTRMENPRASGLQVMSLADTLIEQARHLRRIIVLDCCFAAAAFSAFQSGPAQIAMEKTVDAFEVGQKVSGFPAKGTTLLCSSNHKSPSLLLPDGSSTMFTKAFLDVLVHGTSSQPDYLTLRNAKDVAWNLLSKIRNAPKPVVHSPDQSEGDVADIPFFPNPHATKQYSLELLLTLPMQESVWNVDWVWGNHYLFIVYEQKIQIIDVMTGKTVFSSVFNHYYVEVFWDKESCTASFPGGTLSLNTETSTDNPDIIDKRTGKRIARIATDDILSGSKDAEHEGFEAFIQSQKGKSITTLVNSLVKLNSNWYNMDNLRSFGAHALNSIGTSRPVSFCPPQWQFVAVARVTKPNRISQIEVYKVVSR
jgi:hypothetical protein